MKLRLVRVSEHLGATLGVLSIDGMPRMVTLEEAWRDNQRQISCIPEGDYTIKRHRSPKFGETFIVQNVPGRSHILFHAGNTDEDTLGCILVGCEFGEIKKKPAVLRSKSAFLLFMNLLTGVDTANLQIVKGYDRR
jgi:hypothetical protein